MRNAKEGEVKERREITEGIQRVEELVDVNSINVGISFADSGSSYFIPCLNESALRRQRAGG